jgi:hypothetical protein
MKLVWKLGRARQGVGLLVVLAGVLMSVDAGMRDEGFESQRMELMGLALGGGLFLAGWVVTRSVGGGQG